MLAEPASLANIPRLMTAYYTTRTGCRRPRAEGRVRHLGPSRLGALPPRSTRRISSRSLRPSASIAGARPSTGPLFLGIDTHALSEVGAGSALEVLTAHGVDVMLDDRQGYTPTPVVSHAILTLQPRPRAGLADGIVVTPSHNPPEDGGFKYNPPHGGPADTNVTRWIRTAPTRCCGRLHGVERIPFERRAARHDASPRLPGALRRGPRQRGRPATPCAARDCARRRSAGRRRRPLLGAIASATGCRSPSSATWSIPPSAS
jgi:phosphoglucomutase